MENIIQQAIFYCSLVYVNGNENLLYVWDDSLTMEQKAKDIAGMLQSMGYKLRKTKRNEKV